MDCVNFQYCSIYMLAATPFKTPSLQVLERVRQGTRTVNQQPLQAAMHLLHSHVIFAFSYAAIIVMTMGHMLTCLALQLAALHILRHIVAISTTSHRHQPDEYAHKVQVGRKLEAKVLIEPCNQTLKQTVIPRLSGDSC